MYLRESISFAAETAALLAVVANICTVQSARAVPGPADAAPPASGVIRVAAAGFVLGSTNLAAGGDSAGSPLPFCQSAVKQSAMPARLGPGSSVPHFTVRFALPIPPDNDTNLTGALAGLDPAVRAHNHSPGFEILPNGDALAVYFNAKDSRGASESDTTTCFVQARLRHGAEQWDPPERFFDFKELNDQSGLLWTDGKAVRFFGGGRGASPLLPFKMAASTDNGASWTLTLPLLESPARDYTAQPVVNAFRDVDGRMYFAMDAEKDRSFLWQSADGGVHWRDMGGRTGGRHSTVIPLSHLGKLLSIGGKNTGINGFSPQNVSLDWGATWGPDEQSPFPALGGNQRPSLIRLDNGHLCFVSDSYHRKKENSPAGWKLGEGCFVAISKDAGETWHFKRLPVELPHEADRKHGTLGYATVRQAPNGLIHVLATMTHPCLHYEFNEAWVFSEAGDIPPETGGGKVSKYRENYPDGRKRATWGARVCPNGRYLLDGTETTYYDNGRKEHEASYANGRKTGTETFWLPDGTRVWSWKHDLKRHTSTWTHYWDNGRKRIESRWNTLPRARDLDRRFPGQVADGPARHWNRDGGKAGTYTFADGVLVGGMAPAKSVP